jgi:enoyl-CoA hydratase/carnithine racemase
VSAATASGAVLTRRRGGRVSLAIHRCSKPTIGAIQGHAVGLGITMTLPMTIRIAHKDAKIGFVFARRGLVMEAASSFFLPRLIGMSRSLHLVTTGSTYPASHKLMDGLFSELLDTPQQVLPRALELATEITENCAAPTRLSSSTFSTPASSTRSSSLRTTLRVSRRSRRSAWQTSRPPSRTMPRRPTPGGSLLTSRLLLSSTTPRPSCEGKVELPVEWCACQKIGNRNEVCCYLMVLIPDTL